MSHEFYKRSGVIEKHKLQPSQIKNITGVGGGVTKVTGEVILPLEIAKLTVYQKFPVFEKITDCDMILGRDSFNDNKIKMARLKYH